MAETRRNRADIKINENCAECIICCSYIVRKVKQMYWLNVMVIFIVAVHQ